MHPSSLVRFASLLLAAGAMLLATGCVNRSDLRGLAVQLEDVTATAAPGGGAEVSFQIRYVNENLVPVAAAGAHHEIAFNGRAFAEVESDEPIGLPQMGAVTQTVRTTVDAATAARLRELAQTGSATYTLQTVVRVRAGEDRMRSHTGGSGTIDLSDLQW